MNVTAAVMVLLAPNGKIPKDKSWKSSKNMMAKVRFCVRIIINLVIIAKLTDVILQLADGILYISIVLLFIDKIQLLGRCIFGSTDQL